MKQEEIKKASYAKEKGEVVLRPHEYDGIQEFDQKLPNWWLFTFYGGIVWFVVYWVLYYHMGTFQTDEDRIIAKVGALREKKDAELAAALASLDDEMLINQWSVDPGIVAAGEASYAINCAACHAADLSGTMEVAGNKIPLPGLSLNDGEWKYGAKPMDVFKIINDGTPPDSPGHNGAKMQAWSQMLTPKQVAEITAFLIARNPDDFARSSDSSSLLTPAKHEQRSTTPE